MDLWRGTCLGLGTFRDVGIGLAGQYSCRNWALIRFEPLESAQRPCLVSYFLYQSFHKTMECFVGFVAILVLAFELLELLYEAFGRLREYLTHVGIFGVTADNSQFRLSWSGCLCVVTLNKGK